MLRVASVILAGMLTVVPLAAAQSFGFSAQGVGANDWSEEPNVLSGDRVVSNPYDDPSLPGDTNPVDDNGIEAARDAGASGGAAVPVLQAKWMPYMWPLTATLGSQTGLGLAGAVNPDANNLFRPFVGNDFIYPASHSSFVAFFGQWADRNGDSIRDDEGHWRNSVDGHDREIYVRGNPNDACAEQAASVDPNGSTEIGGGHTGNAVDLDPTTEDDQVAVPVGVEKRCLTEDEWAPPPNWAGTAKPEVVSYVSPSGHVGVGVNSVGDEGGASGPNVLLPCPLPGLQDQPSDCDDPAAQQAPDITYTPGDFYGEGSYSMEAVFTDTIDGSMLETKIVETISEPVHTATGARSHEPADGSLVDVDVYASVSPQVETLFQSNFHGVEDAVNGVTGSQDGVAGEVFAQWAAVNEVVNGVVGGAACDPDPAMVLKCVYQPVIGPVLAPSISKRTTETTGYDHVEGYHMYLDLRMRESGHASAVFSAQGGDVSNNGDDLALVGDNLNPFGFDQACVNGACGSVERLVVDGNLGAWQDLDENGIVGQDDKSAKATKTCPDAYDCGLNNDPGSYTDDGSDHEFLPQCAPGVSGAFGVTLTSDAAGGRWGELGAYLFYDEGSGPTTTQGGRANFNPYDDIVLDAADGTVSRLYTSGPIRMTVVCTNNSGAYVSWEDLYLLEGRASYGITMASDPVAMSFAAAGILIPETVSDTDHSAGWALL